MDPFYTPSEIKNGKTYHNFFFVMENEKSNLNTPSLQFPKLGPRKMRAAATLFSDVSGQQTPPEYHLSSTPAKLLNKQGQTVHMLQLFWIFIPLARLYIYIFI